MRGHPIQRPRNCSAQIFVLLLCSLVLLQMQLLYRILIGEKACLGTLSSNVSMLFEIKVKRLTIVILFLLF